MARARSRYQRNRSRRRFEEIAGWIVVPLIVMVGWAMYTGFVGGGRGVSTTAGMSQTSQTSQSVVR